MKTRRSPRHFLSRPLAANLLHMSPYLCAILPALTAAAINAALIAGSTPANAADEPKPAVVAPLLTKDLTGMPNKEGTMLTVEYLPGGASLPHRHDAHVFVYVLEGSVKMQVDGQPVVTLTAGQTFYENPGDVHRVSANASTTQPAKILVFMVKDKDKPATRSVPSN
jgi:quercetin dioxygenase-like cupin family protein